MIEGVLTDEIGVQRLLRKQLETIEDLCNNFALRFEYISEPEKQPEWNSYQLGLKLRDKTRETLDEHEDIWLKYIFPDPENDD